MKTKAIYIAVVCILFLSTSMLRAQTEFSYRIINENVFTYNAISKNSFINPNNRLQLNELEIVNRFFPVGTFKKNKIRLQAEPKIFLSPLEEVLEFDINELYVQYGVSDKLYVTFGKKRINWGTANVWNPSNPFLQKDPFRIDNRLEGVTLMDFEYISKNLTLNALFSPKERLNRSTFALKASLEIKSLSYSFSYAFLGYEKQQFAVDFSLGADNFTFYGEGLLRNFSNSNLIDSAVLSQNTSIQNGFENMNSEFVVGTMLNVLPRTILIAEYRYRSDFNTTQSIENFKNFLPNSLSIYDPISMGKHSFFGQISYMDSYSKYNLSANTFYDPITSRSLST